MPIDDLIQRDVVTLPPDATCAEVASVMRDEDVGSVVAVEEDGRPVGIVTDRDLVLRVLAAGVSPEKTTLREVMTDAPIFLSGDRSVDRAIRTLRDQRIRRLVLVDPDGGLEGVVSLDDLFAMLASQLCDLSEATGLG